MTRVSLVLLAVCILTVGQAGATVVTSLPASGFIEMPAVNYSGSGPISYDGYTWSSTNTLSGSPSAYGYTGGYGFGSNGYWDGGLLGGVMAALSDSFDDQGVTDTMTFAFSTPVSVIGGFINYAPGGSTPTTIAVWDSTHTLIESYNLTFLTGGGLNTGQLLGFQEPTANISYFTLTDNYVGILGIPEPGTMMLLGSGMLLAIGLGRRRFSR